MILKGNKQKAGWYQSFYECFLTVYILTLVILTIWSGSKCYSKINPNSKNVRLYLWNRCFFFLYLVGGLAWVLDMNFCPTLLPYYRYFPWMGGITLHVVWHFGSGIGAYFMFLTLQALRLEALGETPVIGWDSMIGLLPIVGIKNNRKIKWTYFWLYVEIFILCTNHQYRLVSFTYKLCIIPLSIS